MTAADLTTNLEINDPTKEVVVLTASEGETYISKKFGTITAAQATANVACGTAVAVTFSGATATISGTGITDILMTLTLYGRD